MKGIGKLLKGKDKEKEKDKEPEKDREKEKDKEKVKPAINPTPIAHTNTTHVPPPSTIAPLLNRNTVVIPQPTNTKSGYHSDLDLLTFFKDLNGKNSVNPVSISMVQMINLDDIENLGVNNTLVRLFGIPQSNPVYLILSPPFLLIVDAFERKRVIKKIALKNIQELNVDQNNESLFTIETSDEIFYFVGPVSTSTKLILDGIALAYTKTGNISVPLTISQKGIFDPQKNIDIQHHNHKIYQTITTKLHSLGFSEKDIWEGKMDLVVWTARYKSRFQRPVSPRYLVDFVLENRKKKSLWVSNTQSIGTVLQTFLALSGMNISGFNFQLATLSGVVLKKSHTLAQYGLGYLFPITWCLKLVDYKFENNNARIELENGTLLGENVALDPFQCVHRAVDFICYTYKNILPLSQSHLYTLTFNGRVLNANSLLSSTGYGITTNEIKLVAKKKATSRNSPPTKEIITDIILSSVWAEMERKKKREAFDFIRSLVYDIADYSVIETIKANTLRPRMAALSEQNREGIHMLIDKLEQEEISSYNLEGQKRLADESKVFMLTSIPPPPPFLPPGKLGKKAMPGMAMGFNLNLNPAQQSGISAQDILNVRKKLRHLSPSKDELLNQNSARNRLSWRIKGGTTLNLKNEKRLSTHSLAAQELLAKLQRRHQIVEASMRVEDIEDLD
eukprot:TRINITY_DN5447_c1_g2_i2.p1 TRINITY_DN5447_c1_g2~~TRINITY_DN5447_c1_g2_i2.p1  ORF type:complete len:676 (-),score=164.07 TRINITY_DN5447_c1_g2_i2:206-2233(-)